MPQLLSRLTNTGVKPGIPLHWLQLEALEKAQAFPSFVLSDVDQNSERLLSVHYMGVGLCRLFALNYLNSEQLPDPMIFICSLILWIRKLKLRDVMIPFPGQHS